MLAASLAIVAGVFASFAQADLGTLSTKGNKFFVNGQQFFLKGAAYQGTPNDPLIDTTQCTADANLMSSIGVNSIRVYHVDPTANHDGCMSVFASKGIYLWLDMDTFTNYILQDSPAWTESQFIAYSNVMDAFANYTNLAGLWIGNENINSAAGSPTAPFLKAAVADMKSYMVAKNYRTIPIGYSAADIAELRPALQNYLACGDDPSKAIDFFGLNSYEWCGDATYQTSGYVNLQSMAQGYNIPIFFSETGCNVGGARTFDDQAAIFGPDMVGTWSGAIIYEWVEETNNYGLVSYPGGGVSGTPTPIQPDFDNLSNQWKNANPSGVAEAGFSPSLSAPACPASTAGGWLVNGNVPLPTLDPAVVKAVAQSVKPTPSASSAPTTPTSSASASTTTLAYADQAAAAATASSKYNNNLQYQMPIPAHTMLRRDVTMPSEVSSAAAPTCTLDWTPQGMMCMPIGYLCYPVESNPPPVSQSTASPVPPPVETATPSAAPPHVDTTSFVAPPGASNSVPPHVDTTPIAPTHSAPISSLAEATTSVPVVAPTTSGSSVVVVPSATPQESESSAASPSVVVTSFSMTQSDSPPATVSQSMSTPHSTSSTPAPTHTGAAAHTAIPALMGGALALGALML